MVCGEERFEDMLTMFLIHAGAVIPDVQIHPAVMDAVVDAKPDTAVLALRMAQGVAGQIRQHLIEM